MRIMVINPNSSRVVTAHVEQVLTQIKRPDVELTVVCLENGPAAIESAYDEALCTPGVLDLVKKANREGYDAIILACFSDPALEPARELSGILVAGIQEISLHVASMLGSKFSVLTLTEQRVPRKIMDVRKYRLEGSLASVLPLNMRVAETEAEPERTKNRIRELARVAAERDGAEVILLGCAGMAGYAKGLEDELGVRILDPASVALKVTEAMVEAGLTPSKRGLYALPPSLK